MKRSRSERRMRYPLIPIFTVFNAFVRTHFLTVLICTFMTFATSSAVYISSSGIRRTPLSISLIIAEVLSCVNECTDAILESLKHSLSIDNYFHHRVYSFMVVVICAFQRTITGGARTMAIELKQVSLVTITDPDVQ